MRAVAELSTCQRCPACLRASVCIRARKLMPAGSAELSLCALGSALVASSIHFYRAKQTLPFKVRGQLCTFEHPIALTEPAHLRKPCRRGQCSGKRQWQVAVTTVSVACHRRAPACSSPGPLACRFWELVSSGWRNRLSLPRCGAYVVSPDFLRMQLAARCSAPVLAKSSLRLVPNACLGAAWPRGGFSQSAYCETCCGARRCGRHLPVERRRASQSETTLDALHKMPAHLKTGQQASATVDRLNEQLRRSA